MSVMKPGLTVDLFGDGAVVVNGQRYEPGSITAQEFREAAGGDAVLGAPHAAAPMVRTRKVTKLDKATRTVTFE